MTGIFDGCCAQEASGIESGRPKYRYELAPSHGPPPRSKGLPQLQTSNLISGKEKRAIGALRMRPNVLRAATSELLRGRGLFDDLVGAS